MKIQDGTGRQYSTKVSSDNRLSTNSVSVSSDHFIARNTGKVWSVVFKDIDPAGADDYFIYIKNNSTTFDYNVTDLRISSTVAGQLEFNSVSGTASGGTTNTPVSRKIGSVNAPDITSETGTDITGLTSDGTVFLLTLEADKMFQLRTSSNIIVQPGKSVALLWGVSTGILSGTLSVVEEPIVFDF
jgi:hypothetical protein